ncbi:hypothetical protein [Longimicrobium sp.]|uniref:hypothetical protein n=1 Tax=Longimicrobium sp. TaxID=2029185 RepID=UPI002C1EE2E9|nr:hypothetical protein [Longimicrobium sp.]HSU15514.1 hypothetical protein [Longimicrobium sp.]
MKKWMALLGLAVFAAGCSDVTEQPMAPSSDKPRASAWGVDNDGDNIDDGIEADLAATWAPVLYMPNLITRDQAGAGVQGDWTWPANVEWYLASTQMRFHHDNCPDHQILNLGTINTSNLITQVHQRATSWLGCSHSGTTYGSGAANGYDNGYNAENHFFLQAVYDDVTHPGVRDPAGWKVYTHVYRNNLGGYSIQYWFFYAYNDYFGGFNHESDWEHITVQLNGAQQLASVIYGAHHTPKTVPANQVTLYGVTHPQVWVADGSHASYASFYECNTTFAEGYNESCWNNLDQRWFTWSGGKGYDAGLQGGGLVNVGEMPQAGTSRRPMPGQEWLKFSGHWGEEGNIDDTSGQPGPGQHAGDWLVDAGTGCGEASCTPVTAAYISHYTGADCTGTESYYTAYFGSDGVRRSWDGKGLAGTTLRTVTNRSYRDSSGACNNAWPGGNTLSNFVTIYR